MTRIQVNIPEGTIGDWAIRVATGDSSTIFTQANGFSTSSMWEEPYDTYTFLVYAPIGAVMQDTTSEYAQHEPLWQGATGDVLIGGLGIGFVNQKLMDNPHVTSVTIVEKNQEVIDLVWQHCPKDARFSLVLKDRIGIMHGLIHGLEETPWIFLNTINSFETSLLPIARRLGFGVGICHPE